MMTSGRAAFASSGVISGTGFARAKMIGSFAIFLIISPVISFAAETPTKASAPSCASATVRFFVSRGKRSLYGFMFSFRSFHDGLAGERTDVAQPEHGRAVRDDGDAIPLSRVLVDELGIPRDLQRDDQ